MQKDQYLPTSLQVGDKVKLNSKYFREGLMYFGKELKYPRNKKHFFIVKNVMAGNGVKDGHGDFVKDIIEVDGRGYEAITTICHEFLERIN